ncbi:hypothetical protein HZC07_04805 [Candidatus Micrarchaeota archaeon]|nr:hypothetical protein [Candidatus Micrarchaeota archaeon]
MTQKSIFRSSGAVRSAFLGVALLGTGCKTESTTDQIQHRSRTVYREVRAGDSIIHRYFSDSKPRFGYFDVSVSKIDVHGIYLTRKVDAPLTETATSNDFVLHFGKPTRFGAGMPTFMLNQDQNQELHFFRLLRLFLFVREIQSLDLIFLVTSEEFMN